MSSAPILTEIEVVDDQTCRCGCGQPGTFYVVGYDYNPRAHDRRGEFFAEYACTAAASYLSESSYELGFPYEQERVPVGTGKGFQKGE